MPSTAPTAERLDFARLVREHAHRDALGELCCDVLMRQGRSGSGSPSRKVVKARARALSVSQKQAGTARGNVLEMLMRGPAEGEESELVGAFTAWGLGRWLADEAETPRERELERFVAWLAHQSRYRVFAAARELMPEPALVRLAQRLQDAVIRTEDSARGEAVVVLEALSQLEPEGEHLEALSYVLDDPVVEACADALQGGRSRSERVSAPAPVPRHRAHVEGVWVTASGTGPLRVLAWVTGWALVRRLGSWLSWLLRWQCHARVSLDGRVVRVERWRSVLGREVYAIDESLRADDVRAAVRILRRPTAVTVLGALCLFAGLTGFAVAVYAAVRQGAFAPIAWGLFALGFGAGCDLLLDYAARARGARVWLELTAADRPPLRIAGVEPEAAAQLTRGLDELRN